MCLHGTLFWKSVMAKKVRLTNLERKNVHFWKIRDFFRKLEPPNNLKSRSWWACMYPIRFTYYIVSSNKKKVIFIAWIRRIDAGRCRFEGNFRYLFRYFWKFLFKSNKQVKISHMTDFHSCEKIKNRTGSNCCFLTSLVLNSSFSVQILELLVTDFFLKISRAGW